MPKSKLAKMGFEPNKRFRKEYKNKLVTAVVDGKTIRFRSKLEYGWANFLECLKRGGEIKSWEYETHTFKFDNIGVEKWLVDFVVRNNDDSFEYYECKGYFERRDVDKLKCLFKERPEVQLVYVFGSKPKLSAKKWEYLERFCDRIVTDGYAIAKRVPKYF
jgi:hypothetical protein